MDTLNHLKHRVSTSGADAEPMNQIVQQNHTLSTSDERIKELEHNGQTACPSSNTEPSAKIVHRLSLGERLQGDGKETTPIRLGSFFQKVPKKPQHITKADTLKPKRYSDSYILSPAGKSSSPQTPLRPMRKHQIITVCRGLPSSKEQ